MKRKIELIVMYVVGGAFCLFVLYGCMLTLIALGHAANQIIN